MLTRHFVRAGIACGLLGLAVGACGDSTGAALDGDVSVHFRVAGSTPGLTAPSPARVDGPQAVAGPPLVLVGTNGSLTIDEILLVVDEVELHRADGFCPDGSVDDDDPFEDDDDSSSGDDDCGELEMAPRLLDLPLDGEPIVVVTGAVAPGAYDRIDFEVDDLEDDDSDPIQAAAIAAVRTQILSLVPTWPEEASVRVRGSFTPVGASAVSFSVFLKAEIEVELDLNPDLVVADDGSVSREVTIDVMPATWFGRADGTVLPLHLYDHVQTGELLELEVELEHGFAEIELD